VKGFYFGKSLVSSLKFNAAKYGPALLNVMLNYKKLFHVKRISSIFINTLWFQRFILPPKTKNGILPENI
jgi:hypothetical protein